MQKSTELVYHGIRACARFFTYPTPSIPSDNYTFGQLKGWLWLVYKSFQHFKLEDHDRGKIEVMKKVAAELTQLGEQIQICVKRCTEFADTLNALVMYVDKQAKAIKKESALWEERMKSYL